jgi:hypothetical protein
LLLSPQNMTLQSVLPLFSWTPISDPSGVTYNLEVAVDSVFATVIVSVNGLTGASYQLQTDQQLLTQKNTAPYFWHVRTIDGANNISEWSEARSFYTKDSTPPTPPNLVTPSSGSHESNGAVRFSWTTVPDADPLTYVLEVALDSGFSQVVLHKEDLFATEYQTGDTERLSPSIGSPLQPYYWRVHAVDPAQNQGPWSETEDFFVQSSFQLRGWALYTIIGLGILLVLVGGIFIGVRISRSSRRPVDVDE